MTQGFSEAGPREALHMSGYLRPKEKQMAMIRTTPDERERPPHEPSAANVGRHDPRSQGGWRDEVADVSSLNVLAGIWLVISPWVLGYTTADSRWNVIVIGAVVGALALARVAGAYRSSGLSWINALSGVWLFVSAFWLASSTQAIWNALLTGALVFVLAIWSAATSEEGARRERRVSIRR